MDYKTIIYEVKEGIAFVYLNRAAAMNAIDGAMQRELVDAFERAKEDDAVKAIVLGSRVDGVFSIGLDFEEMRQNLGDSPDWAAYLRQQRGFGDPWGALASQPKPMIAALNGITLGAGLELALACDFRLASQDASFGFPEVRVGLIPMHGGTQRLPRIVGRGKAIEMIMSGESIDAAEAYRVELVSKVVAADELMREAKELAEQLAAKAALEELKS